MLTRRTLDGSWKLFRYLNAAIIIGAVTTLGFLGGTYVEVRRDLPDPENIEAYRPRSTTQIFSTEVHPDKTETHTLLARVFKEDREPEELRNMPLALRQATIAIEDRPFYRHRGIDPKGIIRAALVNLRTHSWQQGGSTITQQLARNMWLTREKTIPRKLKEMLLAAELERRFSKDEILEMYLNEVFYGHGAYGVKRAARLYFNQSPKYLTLAQCALLAGLPQSPIAYSPYQYPKRAKQRRHNVLLAMLRQGVISREQYQDADKEQIQGSLAPLKEGGVRAFLAPYFTHSVIRQLCEQYPGVYEGGLQVYTTLDIRAQKIAEEELVKGVESLRQRGAILSGLQGQGALCAVDPHTGNVLAMVGGVGPYSQTQFNRCDPGPPAYGRQPGSSFKPYIWATALEYGYGPSSTFSGGPLSIPIGNGTYYTPKNYTPRQGGTYTLRNALAQSVNLVSVRIVRKLGVETVRAKATEMLGIPVERVRPFYSMALGANELSTLEQAIGYSTFATGGLRPKPNFIQRITTWDGQEIYNAVPEQVRVIRSDTAVSMISMLRGVVTSGTGRRADISGYSVCGKTGTTNSGRDVWWVGFSPDLSAAVWVGNDNNAPMPQGSGGGFCAPIWARFMKRTLDELKLDGEYPKGSGVQAKKKSERSSDGSHTSDDTGGRTVTVCASSGGLATPYCPETAERTLKAGARGPGRCRAHGSSTDRPRVKDSSSSSTPSASDSPAEQSYTVCAKSGLRAGPSCAQTTESSHAPSGTCRSCGRPREPKPEPKPRPKPRPEPVPGESPKNSEG
jgi:penicillin-binding protein 1A